MSFYTFQLNYKLNRKQLKIINTNIEKYCDKIHCKHFDTTLSHIRGESIYLLDIEIYDDKNFDEQDNDIINLIEFCLNDFENDDKIF